jgi:hypothetical protein
MGCVRSIGRGLAVLGVVAIVVGCSASDVVDGYQLGKPAPCAATCPRYIAEARWWLDRDAPDHPPIDGADVWASRVLYLRSGSVGDYVVVLHIEGGSDRAIMIGCGVGLAPDRCVVLPAIPNP